MGDYGNVTEHDAYTAGGVTEQVKTQYDNRIGDWLISLPTVQTVTRSEFDNDPPAVTRTTERRYDDLGRLDTLYVEKGNTDPGIPQTTSYDYDTYGVRRGAKTTAIGLPDRETRTEYAPMFLGQPNEEVYPSQVWSKHATAAYRPSQWMAVQPAYGVVVASMDANGVQTSAVYDELARPVRVDADGQASTTISYASRPDQGVSSTGTIVTTTAASITSQSVTDGVGRPITYQHTINSQESVVQVVGPTGQERDLYYDRDGRLKISVDVLKKPDNSVEDLATTYEYAPFDQLHKVTDHLGHITKMHYDVRGRRFQLDDPDRGSIVSSYFGTGDLLNEYNAAGGHTITNSYDDLGRRTQSVTEDGTSTFGYDTAANGIGKLAHATSPSGIRTDFRFDSAARQVGLDYTDQSTNTTYRTDTHYDTAGRPRSLEYPATGAGRFTTQYDYNTKGYIESIRYASPGQSALQTLWTVQSRKPNLALDTGLLGAGAGAVTLHNTYDSPTGRLHSTSATNAADAKLMDLTYSYYADGLVSGREQNDSVRTRSEQYGSDTLGRLTEWDLFDLAGEDDHAYTYDAIGNLKTITEIGDRGSGIETRTYGKGGGPLQPHTLTAVTPPGGGATQSYVYDTKGRQVSGGGRTVTYNWFELPKTITKGGQTTTLTYDAFGQKVKESGPNGTTFYLPGLYEHRVSGNTAKDVFYIQGTDGPVGQAVYDGTRTEISYELHDRLGSVGALVDASGNVTRSFYYDPFGQRINPDGSAFTGATGDATHGFTGHEHDDALGLINMKGRVYDPGTKTFLTGDPIVSDQSSGQGPGVVPFCSVMPRMAVVEGWLGNEHDFW